MEAAILAIFVFAGIILVGTVLFAVWVVVSGLRLFGRATGFIARSVSSPAPVVGQPPPHLMRCGHANCRADNLKAARFCRRCGKPFQLAATSSAARPEKPVVRRVAMW